MDAEEVASRGADIIEELRELLIERQTGAIKNIAFYLLPVLEELFRCVEHGKVADYSVKYMLEKLEALKRYLETLW